MRLRNGVAAAAVTLSTLAVPIASASADAPVGANGGGQVASQTAISAGLKAAEDAWNVGATAGMNAWLDGLHAAQGGITAGMNGAQAGFQAAAQLLGIQLPSFNMNVPLPVNLNVPGLV